MSPLVNVEFDPATSFTNHPRFHMIDIMIPAEEMVHPWLDPRMELE